LAGHGVALREPPEVAAPVTGRPAAARSRVCSHAHQSLFQLPPSTWCAAVAVPHRKRSGNEIAMNLLLTPSQAPPSRAPVGKAADAAHPKRPYTRPAMTAASPTRRDPRSDVSVLDEILAA